MEKIFRRFCITLITLIACSCVKAGEPAIPFSRCDIDFEQLEQRFKDHYGNTLPYIDISIFTQAGNHELSTDNDLEMVENSKQQLNALSAYWRNAADRNQWLNESFDYACQHLQSDSELNTDSLIAFGVMPDLAIELAKIQKDDVKKAYYSNISDKLFDIGIDMRFNLHAYFLRMEAKHDNDDAASWEWYVKTVLWGHPSEWPLLANSLQEHAPEGQIDFEQALELLTISENSDPVPRWTYNNLGWTYLQGYGVERDTDKAYEYFLKSTERGNVRGMQNIALMYRQGNGLPKSEEQSFQWYKRAADVGSGVGSYQLGMYYFNGKVVPQDYKRAFSFFVEASERGEPLALDYVASQYFDGHGVEQDYVKAKEWLEASIEYNHPNSFNTLGYMYEEGIGPVDQDTNFAATNYYNAAKLGDARAINNLRALCKKEVERACMLSNLMSSDNSIDKP